MREIAILLLILVLVGVLIAVYNENLPQVVKALSGQ